MTPLRHAILVGCCALVAFACSVVLAAVWLDGARLDASARGAYTLRPPAARLIANLAEPVQLTLYFSERAAGGRPELLEHGRRARLFLRNLAGGSAGKARLVEIDPARLSPEEDQAIAAGLESLTLPPATPAYLGLVGVNAVDQRVVLAALRPEREALLEYDVARLVAELEAPRPPRVGLVTGEEASGPALAAARAALTGRAGLVPLARGFRVIPSDVDVLAILDPGPLAPNETAAILAFMRAKGLLLLAISPSAAADPGVAAILDALSLRIAPAPERATLIPPQRLAADDPLTAGAPRPLALAEPGALAPVPTPGAELKAFALHPRADAWLGVRVRAAALGPEGGGEAIVLADGAIFADATLAEARAAGGVGNLRLFQDAIAHLGAPAPIRQLGPRPGGAPRWRALAAATPVEAAVRADALAAELSDLEAALTPGAGGLAGAPGGGEALRTRALAVRAELRALRAPAEAAASRLTQILAVTLGGLVPAGLAAVGAAIVWRRRNAQGREPRP